MTRGHAWGGDLDPGYLSTCSRGPVLIDEPRGLVHVQPNLVDLDPGLGNELTDDTRVGELVAEGHAALGAGDHERQRTLGHPDGPHRVMDATWPESGLRDRESFALRAQEVPVRHDDVPEHDLRVPVLNLVAEDRQVSLDRHPWSIPWNDDHRLLTVWLGCPAHRVEECALLLGSPTTCAR